MASDENEAANVSALLITFNDEYSLAICLDSLLRQSFGQIIVVDGGSTDRTVEIAADFDCVEVVSSTLGMKAQSIEGSRFLKHEFVFVAEADHVYPDGFIKLLLREFLESELNGLQAKLHRENPSGFFERGHSAFLRLHNQASGRRDVIACPQIWRTRDWLALLNHTHDGERFSFDTERGEAARRLGLTVGVGTVAATEGGDADFSRFVKRHRNYGLGDVDFLLGNWSRWSWGRRVQSLSHVPRTYFSKYPLLALRSGESLETVGYLILIGLFRYVFFLHGLLKRMFSNHK